MFMFCHMFIIPRDYHFWIKICRRTPTTMHTATAHMAGIMSNLFLAISLIQFFVVDVFDSKNLLLPMRFNGNSWSRIKRSCPPKSQQLWFMFTHTHEHQTSTHFGFGWGKEMTKMELFSEIWEILCHELSDQVGRRHLLRDFIVPSLSIHGL